MNGNLFTLINAFCLSGATSLGPCLLVRAA